MTGNFASIMRTKIWPVMDFVVVTQRIPTAVSTAQGRTPAILVVLIFVPVTQQTQAALDTVKGLGLTIPTVVATLKPVVPVMDRAVPVTVSGIQEIPLVFPPVAAIDVPRWGMNPNRPAVRNVGVLTVVLSGNRICRVRQAAPQMIIMTRQSVAMMNRRPLRLSPLRMVPRLQEGHPMTPGRITIRKGTHRAVLGPMLLLPMTERLFSFGT